MSCLTQRSPSALSLEDPPRKNSSHLDVRPAGAERTREGAPDGRRRKEEEEEETAALSLPCTLPQDS